MELDHANFPSVSVLFKDESNFHPIQLLTWNQGRRVLKWPRGGSSYLGFLQSAPEITLSLQKPVKGLIEEESRRGTTCLLFGNGGGGPSPHVWHGLA